MRTEYSITIDGKVAYIMPKKYAEKKFHQLSLSRPDQIVELWKTQYIGNSLYKKEKHLCQS